MRLLLDTQVLIWSITRTKRLSACREPDRGCREREAVQRRQHMEVAIKSALRRSDFDVDPVVLTESARLDFIESPVTSSAAARVADLPRHRRDPFDRLLIAQAVEQDARFVTADAVLSAYSPHVLMV